jgi:hypothetical protein
VIFKKLWEFFVAFLEVRMEVYAIFEGVLVLG